MPKSAAAVKVALTGKLARFPNPVDSGKTRQAATAVYLLVLLALSVHVYRTPIYSMDAVQYMGNALLMEETNPAKIHARVYGELNRFVPEQARNNLLGQQAGAPEDQNRSRQARAADPYVYTQFLPLFAIRPSYNQLLWLLSKSGMGLVRSGILLSAASYFFIGILFFLWLTDYLHPVLNLAFSFLFMITPTMVQLGRENTADAVGTLIAFASLYLIFEKHRLLPGFAFLLASIYFRTDFVVLAGPVILICGFQKRLDKWKGTALAALAVASVLTINHYGGDYGIKMLYYRNFVAVPTNPAEMAVQFTIHDYISAFRSGVTLMMESFFLPFLVLGTLGLRSRYAAALYCVAVAYAVLHFIALPNWNERWFGVFHLTMGICGAVGCARSLRRPELLN